MLHTMKLTRLLEQNMNQHKNKGVKAFAQQWQELLGITEGWNGNPVLDQKNQGIDPKQVSIQELAYTFLGRDYLGKIKDVSQTCKMAEIMMEAEGSVVLPSHFANISAFNASVSGLVLALTMEGYQSPEFIADKMTSIDSTQANGGSLIGHMNDGQWGEDVAIGAPLPTVGLKETKVKVPENLRRGNVIQLDANSIRLDLTGTLQTDAINSGYAVARGKEVHVAKVVQGITNSYERDGKTSNTYRTTRGDKPVDFINKSQNTITDWRDINEGIVVLGGNTDPGTGFEISIPKGFQILCSPHNELNYNTLLNAVTTYIGSDAPTANSQSQVRTGPNPLPPFNMYSSWIWYNQLIAAGVSASNAQARWYMGLFNKAFKYRQFVPYQAKQCQLSSEDERRDIVGVWMAQEMGACYTAEARWVYEGTEEA